MSPTLLVVGFALLTTLACAKVTVHLVPHTHNDIGWLKTVDQYAYGLNNTIQPADINAIIGSAIGGLLADPARRFTYVEIGFFSRWWNQQSEAVKTSTRMLVGENRLQFANGGWCMHDEAATHFIDMIDQTTIGHRFLQRELNVVPKVGWQIDPFGHSATQAAIMSAKAGFLATYHARIDYQDFYYRDSTKQREFMWQASPSLPELVVLGGVLLRSSYGPPSGFSWDVDQLVIELLTNEKTHFIDDNPRSDQNNVKEVMARFYNQVDADAAGTLDDNIMWTMGSDFEYMAGQFWFNNMDKLIKLVKADDIVNIQYSTPYEYTLAKLASNVTYPPKTDDFFPYADGPHQFWTGYFTSRAALKRYIRSSSMYWTASRQIQTLAGIWTGEVSRMHDALSIAQHHDAVTGTSKQHVAFDYAKRLHEGYTDDMTRLSAAVSALSFGTDVTHCPLANVSVCGSTSGLPAASINVIIWNPDGHSRTSFVDIPVPVSNVKATGDSVVSFTVYDASASTTNYGPNTAGANAYTISVEVTLPAAGYVTITLSGSGGSKTHRSEKNKSEPSAAEQGVVVSSSSLQLTFSGATGMLSQITYLATNLTVDVVQDWCYYPSNIGDSVSGQRGGAYIFRPVTGSVCTALATNNATEYTKVVALGKDFAVVEQKFSFVTQRIILTGSVFDIEFTVNTIPIDDGLGKELVMRLKTSIGNGDVFYTDSNGREMQRRVVNQRKYFPFVQTEQVAGNYYPVDTLMVIKDENAQLNVFTDAPIGGGLHVEGEMLLTVFRRLIVDDGRGVSEPLNETEDISTYAGCSLLINRLNVFCGVHSGAPLVIRGRFTIQLLPRLSTVHDMSLNDETRKELDRKYFAPLILFAATAPTVPSFELLVADLDERVQLITSHQITNNTLIIRLAHRYAVNESSTLSTPVDVNLMTLFSPMVKINMISEYSIMTTEVIRTFVKSVVIKPMDIRTFLVTMV